MRVWDIETGTQKHSFNAGFNVMHVEFSPDGQSIAATGLSNQIKAWDVESGEPVLDARLSNLSGISELHYSPDGSELVLAFRRQPTLVVVDATTGEESRRIPIPSFTLGYTFLPGEQTLVVGYGDGSIGLIDYETGTQRKLLRRPPLPGKVNSVHHVPIYCLDVSRDGKLVAAGYRGQYSGHIWDVNTGEPLVNFQTADRGPEQIFFTPDGSHLVLSGSDGVVSLIEVATGHVVGSTERIESHGWAMGMMPDGQSVLVGGGPANTPFPFLAPSGDFGIRMWKLGRADAEVLAKANEPVRPIVTVDQLSRLPEELKLIGIDLRGSSMVRDADLARISDLDQLENLDLSETETTERGFAQLGQLPNLQTLSLAGTHAQSLPPDFGSRFPKLMTLDLHSTEIQRVDSEAIAELRSLESLNVSSTPIETEAIEAFGRLPSLRQIDLSDTTLSNAAIISLAAMPNLQELNVSDARIEATESLLRGDWPALQHLDLINSEVSKEQLDAFRTRHSDVVIASPYDTVDLLPLIDLSRHAPEGKWSRQDGVLKSVGGQCVLPVELPEAFEIRARVRRTAGGNSPIFQLPLSDGTDVMVGFDHWPAEGPFVILHGIDGKMERASPVKTQFTSLPAQRGATCDLSVKVEPVGEAIEITASVNDETVLEWKGDPGRLIPRFYRVNRFQPSIVTYGSVDLLSLELTPLSGAVRLEGSDKQQTHLDREVATWVLERGGRVGITEINNYSQSDQQFFVGLDELPETPFWVTQIDNLFGVAVPADWFQKVSKLKRLRMLNLQDTEFSNDDVTPLIASRSVRTVRFWNTPLNDEGAKVLSKMNRLIEVGLQHTNVTTEGIESFRHHPSLQFLSTDVRSDLVADVALTIPDFRHLVVFSEVDEQTAEKIAQLERLERLFIRKSTGLRSRTLQAIVDQNRLTSLWLQHGDVDSSVVKSISKLSSLQNLDLADNPLGLDGATFLSSLENLSQLRLDDTGIGDESVKAIASLGKLRELYLTGNPEITDQCVPELCRLQNLETLYVHRTGISSSGRQTLQDALPNCEISPAGDSESTSYRHGGNSEGLWWFLRSRSPEHLELAGEGFNDQTIRILAKHPQLQSVTLNGTWISADALIKLAKLPNLQHLVVVPLEETTAPAMDKRTVDRLGEPIAWADLERVRKAFPGVTVEFLNEAPNERWNL